MLVKNPWMWAVSCFFLWAINNVSLRYMATSDVNFIVFTCQFSLFASFTLLAISKPGALALRTLKTFATWGFGICLILEHIILMALMKHVSATEAIFLGKISIITSMLLAWVFLKRRPYFLSIIGLIPLVGGILYFMGEIPEVYFGYTLVMLVLYALFLSGEIMFVEVHETNNQTKSFSDDTRVTALVVGITSLVLLLLITALTALEAFLQMDLGDLTPELQQVFNPKALMWAAIIGVLVSSMTRYLEFISIREIKTEYFLALSSLSPVFTYGIEWALGFEIIAITLESALAMTAILLGSLAVVFTRKSIRKIPRKTRAYMEQAQKHVHGALSYFEGNKLSAAKALGIKAATLGHILEESKVYKDATYKRIKANFDENIVSRDPVTGLQNRLSYLTKLNDRMAKSGHGMLFFIDLNKFKPINDTHGHATGDAILYKIAERLRDNYGHEAEMTRLGGDEFSLFFYKFTEAAEHVASHIKDVIAEHIQVIGIKEPLQVTASVGHAHFPNDAQTAENLLLQADQSMYKEKKNAR